jgi:2-octaprenyl-6-methoxyphenol hydroxylase
MVPSIVYEMPDEGCQMKALHVSTARFEAAVIGAGAAGLAAALALAHKGVVVALIGPPTGGDADRRTTALIGPSVRLLENLGVWAASDPAGLAPSAAPIMAVRIADDRGGLIRAPEMLFSATEIGLDNLGVNIPNPALLTALNAAAARAERLTRIVTAGVIGIEPISGTTAGVRLSLAEGGSVEAALAVAADGRASRAPAAAGIAMRAWAYPQAAVVTSFGHTRPHGDTVNELHRQSGPLTTVPLPGLRSALVWVETPEAARRLTELDDAAFAAALEERLQGVLGSIGELDKRAAYPLAGQRAERMGARRIALVGESAHVVPPIGAQGLNLGLRDAATLADCASEAKARAEDIGGEAMLAAYDRARQLDVLGRSLAIDLLNRSLLTSLPPVDALRSLAVHFLAGLGPLRRLFMQEGAGVAGPLPSLMR